MLLSIIMLKRVQILMWHSVTFQHIVPVVLGIYSAYAHMQLCYVMVVMLPQTITVPSPQ